jgi:hypothetical protein
MSDHNTTSPLPLIPVIISQEGTNQQQSVADLAKDDQDSEVEEIPELRRGYLVLETRYLANDLSPLHRLEDIFADMAAKALEMGLSDVICRLGKRPLRVATMCSGTEAPLLALDMISTGKYLDRALSSNQYIIIFISCCIHCVFDWDEADVRRGLMGSASTT